MRDEALKLLAITCLDLWPQLGHVTIGQVGRLLVDPEALTCPETHVEIGSLLPGAWQGKPSAVFILLVRLSRFKLGEQRVKLVRAVDAALLHGGSRR